MNTAETKAGLGLISARNPARPTAESSERRLWALGEFGAPALATEPAYEEIVDACKCALNLWPDAKAAILYGSRVRGDHRADSDWDIAFITNTETSLPDSVKEVFNGLRSRLTIDLETKAISQAWFLGCADALGNIAAPIAREGRLIAGQCEWPETERDPVLKSHEYEFYRCGALGSIASASSYLADAVSSTRMGSERIYLEEFVRGTAFAAENFAIIAFARVASAKAYTIPRRYQVDEIAGVRFILFGESCSAFARIVRPVRRSGGCNRSFRGPAWSGSGARFRRPAQGGLRASGQEQQRAA